MLAAAPVNPVLARLVPFRPGPEERLAQALPDRDHLHVSYERGDDANNPEITVPDTWLAGAYANTKQRST